MSMPTIRRCAYVEPKTWEPKMGTLEVRFPEGLTRTYRCQRREVELTVGYWKKHYCGKFDWIYRSDEPEAGKMSEEDIISQLLKGVK
jgi:hypothetical protein